MSKNRQLLAVQVIVILAGTIFAWYTVIGDFVRYYNFKFNNCLAPNPLMTTCFYGALFFSAGLIASSVTLKEQRKKSLSI